MRILPSVLILATLAVAAGDAGAQARPAAPDCTKMAERERRSCERDRERLERDRERTEARRERERAERDAQRDARRGSNRDFDFNFDFDFDFDSDSRNLPSQVDTTVAFSGTGMAAELSLGSGEIIVNTWSRAEARVLASSRDGGVRFAAHGGVLTVHVRGTGGDARPRGRIELTVPVGTRIQASGQSVDMQIRGTKAGVRLNTMSGDVVLDDVGGLVELHSISGDVTASRVNGDVELRSVSGDIRLTDSRGDVVVQSVSGDAELTGMISKRVRILTVSGDMSYDGTIDDDGRYSFTSTSGDVDVLAPQNTHASVTLKTFSGGISTAFPITLQPGEHRIGSATGKRFTFDVGRGGAILSLESFSGDITLDQRGATPSGRPRD